MHIPAPSLTGRLIRAGLGAGIGLVLGSAWAGTDAAASAMAAAPIVASSPYRPYFSLQRETQSNGLPVLALDGDWSQGYRPSHQTLRAFDTLRVETGIAHGDWSLGLLWRQEAFAALSPKTAELLYYYQQRRDPTAPTSFETQADSLQWAGQGLTLTGPVLSTHGWNLRATLDLFQLRQLRELQTQGSASYLGSDGYAFNSQILDRHHTTQGVFTSPPAPTGTGWSLSLTVRKTLTEQLDFSLALNDLASQLDWPRINVESSRINSEVKSRNAQGYVEYAPLLSGNYQSQAVQTRLPFGVHAQLQWRQGSGVWILDATQRYDLQQIWLGHAGRFAPIPAMGWSAQIDPRNSALALGMSFGSLALRVGWDNLNTAGQLRSVQLNWVRAIR